MRCAKARTMINLERDGALPPEQTPALEAHLSGCAECRSHREELEIGRRLLKATTAEPSDAFEWKLQLKLNQTLQEAAGANLPWEEEKGSGWFGWLRTFSLSSAAGLAVSLLVAAWLLPGGGAGPALQTGAILADGGADETFVAEGAVTASAGASDRLPLAAAGTPAALTRGGLAGRAVTVGSSSFLSEQPTWRRLESAEARNLVTLQNELSLLRARLMLTEKENEALKALLNERGVRYLDGGAEDQPD